MIDRSALHLLAGASLALSACSSGGPTPTVRFTSPEDGQVVTLDFANNHIDIDGAVATTNFKVAAVGQPGDGQVWIIVDGPQCNHHAPNGMLLPYNTTVPSSEADGPMDGKSFEVGIDYCFNAPLNAIDLTGPHTLTAELHHGDGSPVQADGKTISTSIHITVAVAGDDGNTDAGPDAADGG